MDKIDLAMRKAAVLTEALPYIQDFCGSTVLVKVGGSVMENESNLDSLLADIAFMVIAREKFSAFQAAVIG